MLNTTSPSDGLPSVPLGDVGSSDVGLSDVGLIGLAVMGQNLALNIADHGYSIAVYNRTSAASTSFVEQAGKENVVGTTTLEEFVAQLRRPRRIILMVKAGDATDQTITSLLPFLEPGDIVIDGGNSAWADTERRLAATAEAGVLYVGAGVSGGEVGARFGPSIMPGGDERAWPALAELLQSISAKVDGEPCCSWIGPGSSGHFVKMVHNGIEYGDMQVIAEAYDLVRATGADGPATAAAFASWKTGPLDSYLIEITAEILATEDSPGVPLVDVIRDVAGQKGTGKWTVSAALDEGQPLTLVSEAVCARLVSGSEGRSNPALVGPRTSISVPLASIRDAAYAAKIVSYAQGFTLLRSASRSNSWDLNLGAIAKLWRGGCIIRATFLNDIASAFDSNPDLVNLLLHPFFSSAMATAQQALRDVVAAAASAGIPVPAMASALSFYDAYRAAKLPTNLVQAQRDYFGAHTFERTDRNPGEYFHHDWSGSGSVTSGTYSV